MAFDAPLTESELATALLCESLTEATVAPRVLPDAGGNVVREDGTIKTVIIRPCISRGARIRGLNVIYTPTMLREHAGVFTNWPMFRDHAVVVQEAEAGIDVEAERREMAEAIAEQWMATTERLHEAVKKVGRSIDDLAGRMTRSWWDPDVVFEDDSDFGYQRGGVVGLSLLLPTLREKVGADVGLFHTSINGYPTAGKPSKVPWAPARKGMMIEGIRKVPMGSVDVVVRGGAGGRFLPTVEKPAQEREVSPVQSPYRSEREMPDLNLTAQTSADQLRAALAESAPHLLPVLAEATPAAPAPIPTPTAPAATAPAVTQEHLATALREAQEQFAATLAEREEAIRTEVRTEVQTADQTDRQSRIFEAEAHRMIDAASKANGGFLTPKWAADLKARYSVRAAGPAPSLLVEAETVEGVEKDALTVLRENVKDDIEYAQSLLSEALGRPVVSGQGGGSATQREGATTGQSKTPTWQQELVTERDDDGKVKLDPLLEGMVA